MFSSLFAFSAFCLLFSQVAVAQSSYYVYGYSDSFCNTPLTYGYSSATGCTSGSAFSSAGLSTLYSAYGMFQVTCEATSGGAWQVDTYSSGISSCAPQNTGNGFYMRRFNGYSSYTCVAVPGGSMRISCGTFSTASSSTTAAIGYYSSSSTCSSTYSNYQFQVRGLNTVSASCTPGIAGAQESFALQCSYTNSTYILTRYTGTSCNTPVATYSGTSDYCVSSSNAVVIYSGYGNNNAMRVVCPAPVVDLSGLATFIIVVIIVGVILALAVPLIICVCCCGLFASCRRTHTHTTMVVQNPYQMMPNNNQPFYAQQPPQYYPTNGQAYANNGQNY